jgi:hypothetical protein
MGINESINKHPLNYLIMVVSYQIPFLLNYINFEAFQSLSSPKILEALKESCLLLSTITSPSITARVLAPITILVSTKANGSG